MREEKEPFPLHTTRRMRSCSPPFHFCYSPFESCENLRVPAAHTNKLPNDLCSNLWRSSSSTAAAAAAAFTAIDNGYIVSESYESYGYGVPARETQFACIVCASECELWYSTAWPNKIGYWWPSHGVWIWKRNIYPVVSQTHTHTLTLFVCLLCADVRATTLEQHDWIRDKCIMR